MQAMQETRVQSLGWEDPLEDGMATHSSILTWRAHGQGSLAGHSPWGHKESDMTEVTEHSCMQAQRGNNYRACPAGLL